MLPALIKKFNSILATIRPQFVRKMNRAVFLDRDGTLIVEKNYLHRPEDVEIFPGAGAALKRLADAGFKLIIVTNQSGIGRGYFTLADADYYIPGMTRGQVVIDFLKSWKDAEIPAKEILKIMTVNGYQVSDIYGQRGPIKPGMAADLIAVRENPLENIDTLRDVRWVMKDGMFFKREGAMTPEKFFHSGPTPPSAWRIH